jgi:hypothetical protein
VLRDISGTSVLSGLLGCFMQRPFLARVTKEMHPLSRDLDIVEEALRQLHDWVSERWFAYKRKLGSCHLGSWLSKVLSHLNKHHEKTWIDWNDVTLWRRNCQYAHRRLLRSMPDSLHKCFMQFYPRCSLPKLGSTLEQADKAELAS